MNDDQSNEFASAASNASSITGGPHSGPTPLRQKKPAPVFPVQHLGPVLAAATTAIQRIIQVPEALAAQSVLAGAALATQSHADVELPTGQAVPTSLYFITVASSGDRKTSADKEALKPVRTKEESLRSHYNASQRTHRDELAIWQQSRQEKLKDAADDPDATRSALEQFDPEPAPPIQPTLIVQEPTLEGLYRLFNEGQPSLGLISDEGGQFVGGYSMSKDMLMRTASALSSLWDGSPQAIIRKGSDPFTLAGRRLSVHLMVQPVVAAKLLQDATLTGVGLLSRMLISEPDSLVGQRPWKEPQASDRESLAKYSAAILDLLCKPISLKPGTRNELQLPVLKLSVEARRLWINFSNHIEHEIGPGKSLVSIRPFAAKAAEHAARIAAVITMVENPNATEINQEQLAAAIEIVNYYLEEALRLAAVNEDGAIALAEDALKWIKAQGVQTLKLRDLYSSGPNAARSALKARIATRKLEEHGYLIRHGAKDSWDVRLS
jgi:Protein of unknown function (DUF3987)